MKSNTIEEFLPIFLAIWAVFSSGGETGKYLNDIRDKILDPESAYTLEHKELILEDWKGFFIADILYCLFMFLLTLFLAWNFWTNGQDKSVPLFLCLFISCISIIRLIKGIQIGWYKERIFLEKHIKNIKEEKKRKLL